MQVLAGSKVLCALLTALAVGSGVQTWYLVKLQRELATARGESAPAPEAAEEVPAVSLAPDPGSTLDARVDELFERFHQRFEHDFGLAWPAAPRLWSDAHGFPLDGDMDGGLRDLGDRYELTLELGEGEDGDVRARVERGMLVVSGEFSGSRRASRFERRLSLPADADPASLSTRVEGGRLRVRLDKRPELRASA